MNLKTTLKCTDCQHAVNYPSTRLARWFGTQHGWQCSLSVIPGEFSVVTGTHGPDTYEYCNIERHRGSCGSEARKWMPRRHQDLFKLLSRS
jgi:hypothetical protein